MGHFNRKSRKAIFRFFGKKDHFILEAADLDQKYQFFKYYAKQ